MIHCPARGECGCTRMRPPNIAYVLRHACILCTSPITCAVDVEGSSVSLSIPRAKSVAFGLYSQKVWYSRATYRDSVQMHLLVVYPPLCLHTCFGSFTATHNPMHTAMNSTTYTRFPPKMLFVTENAKSESAAAGPNVR